uniref:Serine/threonine-protein phosphatase 2A 55 kDa regulatory subunit B n=1 Tax=Macrostomum lignano TaxID=282301 RepID=A0A1I8GWY8_9PLAT
MKLMEDSSSVKNDVSMDINSSDKNNLRASTSSVSNSLGNDLKYRIADSSSDSSSRRQQPVLPASQPADSANGTSPTEAGPPQRWLFSQVKGTAWEEVSEQDIISCVEFNHTGQLLATGDKGGRIVVFQRASNGLYNVYSTFTSHEPEFDYLKSLEIEEKINKIRWLPRQNAAHCLLSTNDKTVKLWRVSEKDRVMEPPEADPEGPELRLPRYAPAELVVEAAPRRVFANAHTYHINAISVNSDQETFLSADDLRVNLWHLQVITAAEFHPSHCHLFVYSSSKGSVRLCDMRQRALCDQHAAIYEEADDPANRSFFSEIISSISDVYPVHEHFRRNLCALYENDCIFDKFECCWSGDDKLVFTGSYNNLWRVFNRQQGSELTLEASRDGMSPGTELRPRRVVQSGSKAPQQNPGGLAEPVSADSLDLQKKILHLACHPGDSCLALAATNNLYMIAGA